MADLMRFYMRRIHSLIIICIIAVAASSAKAQVGNDDAQPPVISRVCLWNADQTTWKALGLKRSQIERMNELRQLYPAVVDGQWVASEDMDLAPDPIREDRAGADPSLTTSIKGSAAGTAIPEESSGINTPDTAVRNRSLQYQLREVLTPGQLRRWAQQCEY